MQGLRHWLAHGFALVCVGLLVACGQGPAGNAAPLVPARESGPAGGGAGARTAPSLQHSYAREVAQLGHAIDAAWRLMAGQPDNAQLRLETFALHLERSRLRGGYEDTRLAQTLLDNVAKIPNTLPLTCLAQARLHLMLHRPGAASASLDSCGATLDAVEGAVLRADISFYEARYEQAQEGYRALVNQVGAPEHYVRLALFRSKTGAAGEAVALLEAAEKRTYGGSASSRAWFRLQRGMLARERGRLDEALALYHLAAEELPGWWLIDEQIAEVRRLSSDSAGAQALYQDIIARTGRPEHMDELARLLREGQTPEAADSWIRRAQALHLQQVKSFADAATGHAAEHFLQFGTPAQALELAQRNARARPYGDAQILLAGALYRAGRAGEAAQLIDRVWASGWNTARLHAVAAQIHAGLGQRAQADTYRNRALAMNPYALRMYLVPQPVQPELVSLM